MLLVWLFLRVVVSVTSSDCVGVLVFQGCVTRTCSDCVGVQRVRDKYAC
jgi:hypothetical protein